jgi:hypothetical protein
MPFGFIPDSAFGFVGIPNSRELADKSRSGDELERIRELGILLNIFLGPTTLILLYGR